MKLHRFGIGIIKDPLGDQNMEMAVPIKFIPMGLDQGDDPGFLEALDLAPTHGQVDSLFGGLDQPAKSLSLAKIGAKPFRNREGPETMGHFRANHFGHELTHPQLAKLGMTGGTK